MNPRERLLKVINGGMPDRVPATLFISAYGSFLKQLYPNIDRDDKLTPYLKIIEIQKQLGADVFIRVAFEDDNLQGLRQEGLNVDQQAENWEVRTEEIKIGDSLVRRSAIKTPEGILTQEVSLSKLEDGTYARACTKKPIESPKDLEIAIKYEPGILESYRRKLKDKVSTIKSTLGNDGILGIWTPGGPFNNISHLINHDDLYCLFLIDYEHYARLMQFALRRITEYACAMIEAGADVLCVGGNVAGGFIGKNIYEQYILSYEKKFIDAIQEKGIPAVYHNCGQIMNLAESYKKLGCKVVEPFSPYPLGDADLCEVKKIVNGEYVIIGGVDQVNILKQGTVGLVKEVTEKTMKAGKPGGKFIIQSADFLEYGTPLENLEAYVKTAVYNSWY